LFLPQILLTKKKLYTMPIMVSLLKGDIYKTEYGAVYLGLALTVLPLFIVYFLLSKYIIAGVALGGVKG
jgi:multiple sugar transport system permease protein